MFLKYQSKRENTPHSHNSKFIAIGFRGAADADHILGRLLVHYKVLKTVL